MAEQAQWMNISVDTLSSEEAFLYGKLQSAQKAAREARQAFEAKFLESYKAPPGKRIAVSYRFGIGVAIVDADGRKSNSKGKVSLAEFLKAQDGSGLSR